MDGRFLSIFTLNSLKNLKISFRKILHQSNDFDFLLSSCLASYLHRHDGNLVAKYNPRVGGLSFDSSYTHVFFLGCRAIQHQRAQVSYQGPPGARARNSQVRVRDSLLEHNVSAGVPRGVIKETMTRIFKSNLGALIGYIKLSIFYSNFLKDQPVLVLFGLELSAYSTQTGVFLAELIG